MELVRHRTTVIRQSYEVVRFHYDYLPRSWSQHLNTITVVRWLCGLVPCRKTSHDHGTTLWEGRAHENMWKYGTKIRDVALRQEMSHGVARWLYDTLHLGHRNQVVWYRTIKHDYARLTADGPRSPKLRPSQVVVRCPEARCDQCRKRSHDHRTRYLWEGRPMPFINIFGWEHV